MKIILLIISFLWLSLNAESQNEWFSYNDSTFQQTKAFYSTCNSLTSSKAVTKDQFKYDQMLMRLASLMYNKDDLSLRELTAKTMHFRNRSIHKKDDEGIIKIEFNANTNGNLYLNLNGILVGDIITSKEIYLATRTQVLCNDDYVNFLDFLYLQKLLQLANFPMMFKPYQDSLVIKQIN